MRSASCTTLLLPIPGSPLTTTSDGRRLARRRARDARRTQASAEHVVERLELRETGTRSR